MNEIIMMMGLPSAITGLLVWWLKRYIDKKEKEREVRLDRFEDLIDLVMRTNRANNILATATAKAVQRMPEAQCNGDMSTALEEAAKIDIEEQNFFYKQGIEHIVGSR